MTGCSCEHYTHEGDCDYCQGFKHGGEHKLKIILKIIDEWWKECQENNDPYEFTTQHEELKGRIINNKRT